MLVNKTIPYTILDKTIQYSITPTCYFLIRYDNKVMETMLIAIKDHLNINDNSLRYRGPPSPSVIKCNEC